MYLLHNIGVSPSQKSHIKSNYNTREQIQATEGILTFDGVYKNVWENRDILKDRDVILFIMGDYVGKDNRFDVGMPREEYCDWNQIMDLVNQGAQLGWHTKTHRDLTTLSRSELEDEIKPPFPMEHFAYPYGNFNQEVIDVVRKYYTKAYSVSHTISTPLTIKRKYICNTGL